MAAFIPSACSWVMKWKTCFFGLHTSSISHVAAVLNAAPRQRRGAERMHQLIILVNGSVLDHLPTLCRSTPQIETRITMPADE